MECCSYQWSDFDDHAAHMAEWIDETKRKNDEMATEKCGDIVEKKAQLKRAKVRKGVLIKMSGF